MLLLIGIQGHHGACSPRMATSTRGPLNNLVSGRTGRGITDIHYANFNVLAVMIGIHIAAIFFYLLYKREESHLAHVHRAPRPATRWNPSVVRSWAWRWA